MAGQDGTVRSWKMGTSTPLWKRDLGAEVAELAFSLDGSSLFVRTPFGDIGVLDARTGLLEREPGFLHGQAMRPAANGKVVVATENAILLQEGDDGRTVRSLEGHAAPVTCLDTFGGGTGCVSGSEDRTVKRWMLETGDPPETFKVYVQPRSVSVSGDGRLVACSALEKVAFVWDLGLRKKVSELEEKSRIYSTSVSPNGSIVATAGDAHAVSLWDARAGSLLRRLHGHQGGVYALAFSRDGSLLATGSADKVVRVFEVETAEEVASFRGHVAEVCSVAFAPDGTIASAGGMGRPW